MPRHADVEIFEEAVASHVDLPADRLFSRRAVESNRSFELAGGDKLFNSDRGAEARRAKQVVSAAVTRRTGFQSLFHGLSLLRNPRKRIVLAENSDDGPALPVARDKRRRHARDSAFNLEALLLCVIGQHLR